jgi:meso-butanediol dehydrogenase/(S,S)-butanediol dehydrogenase/diacetyl reductase
MQLEGKVALVTGGGTGIGAAITERLVAEGAKVCITGRRQEMLEGVAGSLPAGSVTTCVADVCRDEDAKRMVETALGINGRLDILINNAGVEYAGTVIQMDSAVWRQELEINLTGPFLMMKEALPCMIESGGGTIINISSLAGVRCVPGSPAYCATKAGLIHLTKQVALDYGKDKIRCNVICPGDGEGPRHRPRRRLRAAAEERSAPSCGHALGGRGGVRVPGRRRFLVHHRYDDHGRRRHSRSGCVRFRGG